MIERQAIAEARFVLGCQLAELRKAAGYTQHTLAPLTLYARSTLANVEIGRQNVPRSFWELCDELLDTGGALSRSYDDLLALIQQWRQETARALELRGKPQEHIDGDGQQPGDHPDPQVPFDPVRRRTLVTYGLATTAALHMPAINPDTLTGVLRDSAAEAMEFTRSTAVSAVGTGTLDHLEAVLTDLERSYWAKPPEELLAVARTYRQRVDQLIHGQHTLKEERELYFYAAWLSELLALLAHDFGVPLTAEAYALDSYEHADQAGHDVLCGWASETMATIALHANRPGKAALAAQKCIGRIPDQHPLAVRLRTQAACAFARRDRRAECAELLTEAQALHDRLPTRKSSRLPIDDSVFASHSLVSRTSSSYVWLADYPQAETHARTALAVLGSADPADRSPKAEASARINLGIALAHLGSLDEAAAHGSQALSSIRAVDSVLSRAGELDQALMTRFPREPATQSFHEQYRQLATTQANGQ